MPKRQNGSSFSRALIAVSKRLLAFDFAFHISLVEENAIRTSIIGKAVP